MNPPWISPQFCVLAYRTQPADSVEPKQKDAILSAFLDLDEETEQYKIKIFVDPNWRKFVQNKDREYIELLLGDLVQRACHDAEMLFKQLCSLNVGPIVTSEVGMTSSMTSYLSITEPLGLMD